MTKKSNNKQDVLISKEKPENKLWLEGGYWEMNFSVTKVTWKKDPQQQLRFKLTTNKNKKKMGGKKRIFNRKHKNI